MLSNVATVVLAALAVTALAACGGDGSPAASPSATTPAPVTTTASLSPTASPTGSPWPAGCRSPMAMPAGATVIAATVSGGTVSPPRRTYDVELKSLVRLVVTSDKADELHLHTYDRKAILQPGCPGVIDFEAGIPGSVEVELEHAGVHVLQVRAR